MQKIFAPWRIEYLDNKKQGCLFCECQKEDERNLILLRGKKNFIIMNRYPYSNGHLMVAPFRHVTDLEDLEDEEKREHFEMVIKSKKILGALNPDSFNIGMNLGKSAGAGFEHIHTHIVPRWLGDTNFMPVIADTKVIPEALNSTYNKLKEHVDRVGVKKNLKLIN